MEPVSPTARNGDKLVTTDARQIAITEVEQNSPADGVLAIGDVILGISGKRCILEQGCRVRAARIADPAYRQNAITRSLNALALLASGQEGAEFFSRMSVASHGPERDTGHTGNFFNILWSLPGVAQSGPHATGAWMQEFGGWYFDLARRWDGTSLHHGPPETSNDQYPAWDCTGGYLLVLRSRTQMRLGSSAAVCLSDASLACSHLCQYAGFPIREMRSPNCGSPLRPLQSRYSRSRFRHRADSRSPDD